MGRGTKSSSKEDAAPPEASDAGSSIIAARSAGRGFIGIMEALKKMDIQQEIDTKSKKSEGSEKSSTAVSKPESEDNLEPIFARGTKGAPIAMLTNYIRLDCQGNFGVYEYEVKFLQNVEAKNLRFRYLNQHKAVLGDTMSFDGVTLYLPKKLPELTIKLVSEDLKDGSKVCFS